MKTKRFSLLLFFLSTGIVSGCAELSDLSMGGVKNVPPEFRQLKVGLYVHDKAENLFYPGRDTVDVLDLMGFHLQQTLPFNTQTALQEIFKEVEIKEEGPKIVFKSPDLAGYFEIKISSVRYDQPDSGATRFRAEVQLMAEFKTFGDDVVWQGIYNGGGVGFDDTNIRLTRFGRTTAPALEDAFQNAIYELQDGIVGSPTLLEHFRWYLAKHPTPRTKSRP